MRRGKLAGRRFPRTHSRRPAEETETESVYRWYAIAAERDLAEGVAKPAALPAPSATLAGQVVPFDRDALVA
jgi:hypothetical protein